MLQHSLVAVGNAVMCLVNDDGAEIIGRELSQPFFSHQSLHRAYHNPEPASPAGFLCFLHSAAKPCSLLYLIRRLLQQLSSVGQYQDPLSLPDTRFRNLGKHNSLSAAGREDQEGLPVAVFPLLKDSFLCFLLVWSQFH